MKEITTDDKMPEFLKIKIEDSEGNVWSEALIASGKQFSTGSTGYYLGEKITNPRSGKRYQVSGSFILIGSKPPK